MVAVYGTDRFSSEPPPSQPQTPDSGRGPDLGVMFADYCLRRRSNLPPCARSRLPALPPLSASTLKIDQERLDQQLVKEQMIAQIAMMKRDLAGIAEGPLERNFRTRPGWRQFQGK